MGGRLRLICQDIQCVKPIMEMPNLPVARVMWKPMPDLIAGVEAWIIAGGAHHTVLSYDVTAEQMKDWARIMDIEFVHINKDTTNDKLEQDLFLSDLAWKLNEVSKMLEKLKKTVYKANMDLVHHGLVIFTWGNVSGIDREKGLVVIKPSGVEYEQLTPDNMVVVDLDGKCIEGDLNPSSDTLTHIELYKAFSEIGGIVHTHSTYAVAWAQAGQDIPCCGTTHADYFYGPVPCTRTLTAQETQENYEKNTGKVIVETFASRDINPLYVPGVICRNHGPLHGVKILMSLFTTQLYLRKYLKWLCLRGN